MSTFDVVCIIFSPTPTIGKQRTRTMIYITLEKYITEKKNTQDLEPFLNISTDKNKAQNSPLEYKIKIFCKISHCQNQCVNSSAMCLLRNVTRYCNKNIPHNGLFRVVSMGQYSMKNTVSIDKK